MKNLFITVLCFSSMIINAQVVDSKKTATPISKPTLARLIKTRVIVKDISAVNTSSNHVSDSITETSINYLEPANFFKFKQSILKIADSKDALVFDPAGLKIHLTKKDIEYKIQSSDRRPESEMLQEYFSAKIFNISAIDFYESWNYNEKNKMIEKEILAYQILTDRVDSNSGESMGYQPLFIIVKDNEAKKKLSRLGLNN
jgi:hypothetical protein